MDENKNALERPQTILGSSLSKEESDQSKERQDAAAGRTACTECQRRKQKCNREWPCNHCRKRKVADKCRFKDTKSPSVETAPSTERQKKRQLDTEDDGIVQSIENGNEESVDGFEALGYASGHFFADLKISGLGNSTREPPKQYYEEAKSCPQLQRALQVLPPRPYTDSLVQNFLTNVNFHYYIIYPKSFLEEYQAWWSDRSDDQPLGLQWTCLLLMICACSTQYITVELEKKLETDLGESCQTLTENYHTVARELHSAIPLGHNHMFTVQQLLHSCYWFKSEARFVECWHVLSAAIREAQELGIHRETANPEVPEFEREIHRRVWCVLDTWDWQISALLSRPMIINRSDCDVGLPSLSIEPYSPSPLLHMKMQSELIARLSARFDLPKNVTSPEDVKEYQAMMEDWMSKFPPTYAIKNPDTSKDAAHPWIVLHRHYLHTMSHSMILDPIRAYLARNMNSSTSDDVLQIRRDGVDYSLKLMECLYGFFDHVWPRDAKFHFVIFCIFDTAAVYSSVFFHDEEGTVERRDDMLAAMGGALGMLKKLSGVIQPAEMYHDILTRLQRKVLKKLGINRRVDSYARKRAKVDLVPLPTPSAPPIVAAAAAAEIPAQKVAIQTSQDSTTLTGSTSPSKTGVPFTSPDEDSSSGLSVTQTLAAPLPAPIYPDETFDLTPFINESWQLNGDPIYQMTAAPPSEFLAGDMLPGGHHLGLSSATPENFPAAMPDMGFTTMTTEELGALGDLWRWDSLDLGLIDRNVVPDNPNSKHP